MAAACEVDQVVPYVGTWIEMHAKCYIEEMDLVVPYVGTWIEIFIFCACGIPTPASFPTWERG